MGLERSKLQNLKVTIFDFNKNIINIDSKKIPLPRKIKLLALKVINNNNKTNGYKGDYLFPTKYNNKFNSPSATTINYIFNKIGEVNENWRHFSPQYIRNELIKLLYKNNYSLEEVMYLTGIDLVSIADLISYNEILIRVNLLKKQKGARKHPFEELLN